MEITWIGFILAPLGLFLAFFWYRGLYLITVFFIPFTATSLVNSASGAALSAFQYLVICCLLGHFGAAIVRGGAKMSAFLKEPSSRLAMLFLSVICLSVAMPIIIAGDITVSSNDINNLYQQRLILTDSNWKLPFPAIIGIFFLFISVIDNQEEARIIQAVRVAIFSSVFVSLWGLMQKYAPFEYPYYIFNTATAQSMMGYKQIVQIGEDYFGRVSSVTHEASILCKYLLTIIPFLTLSIINKRRYYSTVLDYIFLIIIVSTVLLSTSSTGIIGVLLALATTFLVSGISGGGFKKTAILVFIASVAFLVLYFEVAWVKLFFDSLVLNKSETGSWLARRFAILNSFQYFLQYPLLGIGWGNATSYDLVVFLLANVGIIGFLIFFWFIFSLVKRGFISLARGKVKFTGQSQSILAGALASLIVEITLGLVSGLEFYLGYFYFVCAIAISATQIVRMKSRNIAGAVAGAY